MYKALQRWPLVNLNTPGFDLIVDSIGNNTFSGSFRISQSVWNPDGTIAHFGALFDVVNDAGYPNGNITEYGAVYFRYDVPQVTPEADSMILTSAGTLLLLIFGLRRTRRLQAHKIPVTLI